MGDESARPDDETHDMGEVEADDDAIGDFQGHQSGWEAEEWEECFMPDKAIDRFSVDDDSAQLTETRDCMCFNEDDDLDKSYWAELYERISESSLGPVAQAED